MGIDRNRPFRTRAALRYPLQDLAGQGHCGYPEPKVLSHAVKLVDMERSILAEAVERVVLDGSVVRETVEVQPWLYLASLYWAEVGLAQSIHRIASATRHPLPGIDDSRALWLTGACG